MIKKLRMLALTPWNNTPILLLNYLNYYIYDKIQFNDLYMLKCSQTDVRELIKILTYIS